MSPSVRTSAGSFLYFLLVAALSGVIGNIIGFLMPVYLKEIGFSGLQIGLFFGLSGAANVLLALPMGISTDRLSIVGILVASAIVLAFSRFGLVLSHNFWIVSGFAFTSSFGLRLYNTAMSTLFFKMSGRDNGHKTGIYQIVSFASMALGMMLGGVLIDTVHYEMVFLITAIGNLVLIAFFYGMPKNETVVISMQEYRAAVLNKPVLFFTAILFLFSLHWGAEAVAYGPFLTQVLHLSPTQSGWYTGGGFLFIGSGTYLGFVAYSKGILKNIRMILIVGFLLSGSTHIAMTIPDPLWSFCFRALHEFGDGMYLLAFYHGLAKLFNLDKIGGCSAFISLWQGVAALCGSIIFGIMVSRVSPAWPLIISGIITLMLPILLLWSATFGLKQSSSVASMLDNNASS